MPTNALGSLVYCEARIQYTDTIPIRKNFKNQDTIRSGYVNKQNYIIKCTL